MSSLEMYRGSEDAKVNTKLSLTPVPMEDQEDLLEIAIEEEVIIPFKGDENVTKLYLDLSLVDAKLMRSQLTNWIDKVESKTNNNG